MYVQHVVVGGGVGGHDAWPSHCCGPRQHYRSITATPPRIIRRKTSLSLIKGSKRKVHNIRSGGGAGWWYRSTVETGPRRGIL
jgi:hypothetical protein